MNVLRDAWECSPIIEDEAVGPTFPNPVQFADEENLDHFEGPLESSGNKEIVAWIFMVVLSVVTLAAFYVLWLKAGG
jgi:hypothetical protein